MEQWNDGEIVRSLDNFKGVEQSLWAVHKDYVLHLKAEGSTSLVCTDGFPPPSLRPHRAGLQHQIPDESSAGKGEVCDHNLEERQFPDIKGVSWNSAKLIQMQDPPSRIRESDLGKGDACIWGGSKREDFLQERGRCDRVKSDHFPGITLLRERFGNQQPIESDLD